MQFKKECRKIVFSLTFVLYVLGVCAMYFTQFHSDSKNPLTPPVEGIANYGTIKKEVPEILMPAAINGLVDEYCLGSYIAYPIGFYKSVRLSEKKTQEMADIIYELSGVTKEQLESLRNKDKMNENNMNENNMNENNMNESNINQSNTHQVSISSDVTYENFRKLMSKADKLIGGGSKYSDQNIVGTFSCVPKTYEEALAEYNTLINEDKVTEAYARLYCDYLGIPLAILPVFISVAICLKDKRTRMLSLVYSRKISSAKLITTRYFAMILMMIIPILVTALAGTLLINKIYPNNQIDMTALFRYGALWLVPNIMISTALGMFITELTSTALAILINGMWWFISIVSSSGSLTGSIGKFTLIVRHNTLFESGVFAENFNTFLFNRVFFVVISIILILLTAVIYGQKRSGRINGFWRLSKNNKIKSAA